MFQFIFNSIFDVMLKEYLKSRVVSEIFRLFLSGEEEGGPSQSKNLFQRTSTKSFYYIRCDREKEREGILNFFSTTGTLSTPRIFQLRSAFEPTLHRSKIYFELYKS